MTTTKMPIPTTILSVLVDTAPPLLADQCRQIHTSPEQGENQQAGDQARPVCLDRSIKRGKDDEQHPCFATKFLEALARRLNRDKVVRGRNVKRSSARSTTETARDVPKGRVPGPKRLARHCTAARASP